MKKALKLTLSAVFAFASLSFSVASAQETESAHRSSCRAKEVERYYCPSFGGDQLWGPYYDRGCAVTCAQGQRAICNEASCEDNQSGQPVESSCTCQ